MMTLIQLPAQQQLFNTSKMEFRLHANIIYLPESRISFGNTMAPYILVINTPKRFKQPAIIQLKSKKNYIVIRDLNQNHVKQPLLCLQMAVKPERVLNYLKMKESYVRW